MTSELFVDNLYILNVLLVEANLSCMGKCRISCRLVENVAKFVDRF